MRLRGNGRGGGFMLIPILACLECDQRLRNCNGSCPCLIDSRDIVAHADSGYCPHPEGAHFGDGVVPANWANIATIDVASLPAPASSPAQTSGPGDVVRNVLACLEIRAASNCGCEAMRQSMNQWGWWGCWKRRREIVEWFSLKAKEQEITIDARLVLRAIVAAWREIRPSAIARP